MLPRTAQSLGCHGVASHITIVRRAGVQRRPARATTSEGPDVVSRRPQGATASEGPDVVSYPICQGESRLMAPPTNNVRRRPTTSRRCEPMTTSQRPPPNRGGLGRRWRYRDGRTNPCASLILGDRAERANEALVPRTPEPQKGASSQRRVQIGDSRMVVVTWLK